MMKKNLFLMASMCVALFALGGCQNDDIQGEKPEKKSAKEQIEKAFDYKLTVNIPVTIDYPQMARIEVFDQIPDIGVNATMLYAAFTNNKGKYQGQTTIAKAYLGKKVYAICYYPGCPLVTEATVTEKGLFIKATKPETKAVIPGESITVPEDLVAKIEARLPEHKDNSKFINGYTDTKNIDVRIKGSSTIDVTFVRAQGWYDATLYYFVYRGKMPSKQQILNCYINENHKVFGPYNSYPHEKDPKKSSDKNAGTTVRLKNGQTTEFKAGDRIGFVLLSNAKKIDNSGISYQFSYKGYNTHKEAQAARFVYTAADKSQSLVYAFEDIDVVKYKPVHWGGACNPCNWYPNGDRDYNDLIFMVKANPFSSIDDPNIQPLPEAIYSSEQISGTLLFEDNYPKSGDYDMNDFVAEYTLIKHFYSMTDGSVVNQLTKLEYYITPKWDGAWYGADFSFMIDGHVSTPVKVYTLKENQEMGKLEEETIHGEVKVKGDKDKLLWDAFNPFITVKNTNREIHLTKKAPSPTANLEGLDEFAKNYVLVNSKYPYALNVPTTDYNIVPERVRIDTYYPKYAEWVNSDGTMSADWFKHPKK